MLDAANVGEVSAATEICSECVSVSPSVSRTVQVIPHCPVVVGFPLTAEDVTVKPGQVPLTEYVKGALPPLADGRVKLKSTPTIAPSEVPDEANVGEVSAATEICSECVSVSPSVSRTVQVIPHCPVELGVPLAAEVVTVRPAQLPLTEYVKGELPPLADGRVKLKSTPTIAPSEVPDAANVGEVSAATATCSE